MANDYVAPGPGGFVVVVGGKQVGTYPDQASAEQAFNSATGKSNAPPAAGGGDTTLYDTPNGKKTLAQMQQGLQGAGWNGNYNDPAAVIAAYNGTASGSSTGDTSTASSAQKLLDAIASGDQSKFDEAVKEFNTNFAENQRQFNTTEAEKQREFDTSNYTNLGTTLLNTAANLRGPKDYYQFQQYTSGGRDLMSQLYGNQPRPDFSAPTGAIQPETVGDLLGKLGFTTSPIAGTANAVGATPPTANTPTPGSYTTVNGPRTVDQMYQELKGAGWGGSATDTNAIVAAYQQTTGNPVTPQAATTVTPSTANTVAPNSATPNTMTTQAATAPNTLTHSPVTAAGNTPGGSSYGASTSPMKNIGNNPNNQGGTSLASPTGDSPSTTPFSNAPSTSAPGNSPSAPSFASSVPTVPKTPLPYQVNPAVFDALGPVGQGLLQSQAEANGWDWSEYLRQLNASRPQGTAPGASTTSFSSPMGSFA